MVSARALHFVLKIGDRAANANFFRNILGMKVRKTGFFFGFLPDSNFSLFFYSTQFVCDRNLDDRNN